MPSDVAMIVARPGARAVTVPSAATVAMAGSLDFHATPGDPSVSAERAALTMARSTAVVPTTSTGGTPSITTSTTGAAVIVTVTARATPPDSATITAVPRRF